MNYADRPCNWELFAIILAGLLHVVTELAFSETAAMSYNAVISVVFGGYLIWRVRQSGDAIRAWGMRTDNFWRALLAQGVFAAVSGTAIIGYGVATDASMLPESFWLTLGLYPIWGIAQQFALQSLIARNLEGLITRPMVLALVAAALFAASHYPRLELVALTGIGGVFLTLIYRRIPNLWAAGIIHGVLGSLAFYLVLKEDPGAMIIGFFSGQ